MTSVRRAILLLLSATSLVGAQPPTMTPAAVGNRMEPLQVLDDAGKVITEQEIQALLQPRYGRRLYVVGAAAGLLLGVAVSSSPRRACDIYEPCSPRENFRKDHAWWVGLAAGTMIGFALPDGVNREQAVAAIRAKRRGSSAGAPP
jgi:hypothetical protein